VRKFGDVSFIFMTYIIRQNDKLPVPLTRLPDAGCPIHRGGIAMSGVCECSRRFQVMRK